MRGSGTAALTACATILICLTILGLAMPHSVPGQFGIGYGAALDRFVALGCVQGAVYAIAVALLLRKRAAPSLALVLGVAFIMRAMVVAVPPFLSNDIYRYVWDGWVQAAGINPYRYIPDDQHLAFLRDNAVFPNINRASYAHTIYPPAAQIGFLLITSMTRLLALPPVLGMKLAMLGFEAAAIWAMLGVLDEAGLPRSRVLIYAWNPIPLWEFAGSGHVDAMTVCAIAFALLAACRARTGLAGAALGLAVLTKFLPIALAPALWRRWDWKFGVAITGVVILLYLPYLGAGRAVFGFLGGYAAQEGIDSGHGIFLLDALGLLGPVPGWGSKLYLALFALALAGVAAWMVWRPRPAKPGPALTRLLARRCLILGGVLMLGISPHYPWYFPFLLLPACVVAAPAAIYLVTASVLLYLNPTHTGPFWPAMVFLPAAALAAGEFLTARPAVSPAPAGAPQ
jgi:hypothetical protein